jgi:hypothetical protein
MRKTMKDLATQIVEAIIFDIHQKRGMSRIWHEFNVDARKKTKEDWIEITKNILKTTEGDQENVPIKTE